MQPDNGLHLTTALLGLVGVVIRMISRLEGVRMNDRYIKWRVGITLLLLIVVLIFTVQNAEMVDVQILSWTVPISRAFLIFWVFFTGVIVGWSLRVICRMIKG